MFAPLYSRMPDVVRSVYLSTNLEKMACENPTDAELCRAAWVAKIAVDNEIFAHARNFADKLEKNANPTIEAMKGGLPMAGENLLKGLGYGAGIGIPLAGAGAYIAHRGRAESEEAAKNLRNQVLMTALGLGGIGLGAYGLKRMMDPSEPAAAGVPKQASDEQSDSAELLEKLSAVGSLDEMLDQVDFEKLSEAAKHEFLQTRVLNRGYGVRLLYEALQA